ncbi:hypothetical protein CH379_019550 [Leptospira ellisii]|uniref:Uncharacterized protein n=1 Tax=Leptospira ellisii TaxID=2023197 RepID=A0A2N0BI25_9LEPT|nr:hypothetical protein [Leptospira ellisii]MDV6237827.1 hypothetical protein [Leptospira ellisii]PJZ92583.1 hypothetical protein CH379_12325 [Leptospira ellisii]PKA03661.1 hypothetical protein CH375_15650 [Leptospira ellisii]
MNHWEILKLILMYTFGTTILFWFALSILTRAVVDIISFFSSWFITETSDQSKEISNEPCNNFSSEEKSERDLK